jgi:hypothetical protein
MFVIDRHRSYAEAGLKTHAGVKLLNKLHTGLTSLVERARKRLRTGGRSLRSL